MEVKGSERRASREVGSEGKRGAKIRADGQELDLRPTASDERPMIAKTVSIKELVDKSGGRVSKAVGLIAGDLLHVSIGTERGVIHADPVKARAEAGVVPLEVDVEATRKVQ